MMQVQQLIEAENSEHVAMWIAGVGQAGRDHSADDFAFAAWLARNGVTDPQTLADALRTYRYRTKLDRTDYVENTIHAALRSSEVA